MVTKCTFRHNLTEATKQKTDLAKAVKDYELMMEMPCIPLNIESFGHKMFLLQEGESCILACEIFSSIPAKQGARQ